MIGLVCFSCSSLVWSELQLTDGIGFDVPRDGDCLAGLGIGYFNKGVGRHGSPSQDGHRHDAGWLENCDGDFG
jgi:hypothetical protein